MSDEVLLQAFQRRVLRLEAALRELLEWAQGAEDAIELEWGGDTSEDRAMLARIESVLGDSQE